MKKWKAFFSSVLLITVLFSSCSLSRQHVYDPAERVVLSANSSDVRLTSNFDLNLLFAQTVAVVKITSDGEVGTQTLLHVFEDLPPEKRPKVKYTAFEAKVEEVWQGEPTDSKITLHIAGDLNTEVTKPLKGDRLVLFLKCVDGIYYLIDDEYSIFAVNPGAVMYAFGDKDSFTCYDNAPFQDFKESIQDQYDHMPEVYAGICDRIGPLPLGPIAESYMNAESSDDT